LIDGKRIDNPTERQKILFNQDRHFSAKLQLLKEGEFGISWLPAVAIGACDPISATLTGYREQSADGDGSGVFNRYYIAVSKSFNTKIGELGLHVGYQYNQRKTLNYNSPSAAIDWKPIWITRWKNSVLDYADIIAEFDGHTFNVGFIASIWKNRFEAMFELMSLKYIQAGLRYKIVLKS
jgi:hypothetical protein